MKHFFSLWAEKVRCWLCDNNDVVAAAYVIIRDLVTVDIGVTHDRKITQAWLDTCLPAYLLAMFATSRSTVVQSWRFYEFGLNIIWSCQYDDAMFYRLFDVTPTQIAYVFFLLGYAYDFPKQTLPLRPPLPVSPWAAPLVVDVGMGLGADTRYYLAQGFRVVAVEANPQAISTAISDRWTAPFLRSGQLSILHAAVSAPGKGGGSTSFFALPHRPEMSNSDSWIASDGGERISVRTVECADLLRVFGRAVYMKIDIESNSVDCLESLHRAHTAHVARGGDLGEGWAPPALLSLEVEAADLATQFLDRLEAIGYVYYKMCRQYIYSPAPCEQGQYGPEVPGCGSGPFGDAAVDYLRGVQWSSIRRFRNDTAWAYEFEGGLDWFDLHVKLPG